VESTSYSAEIAPDPRLRRIVLVSGAALWLAGLGFVPLLPVSVTLKTFLAATWVGLCSYQWQAMWRGLGAGQAVRGQRGFAAIGLAADRAPRYAGLRRTRER